MTRCARRSSTAALVFTFLCIDLAVSKGCDYSRGVNLLEKANCTGYQVGVHSVWTEIQCLDNCFRRPHCDKYIFDGQGNQNCKLLNTGENEKLPGAENIPKITGTCAPENVHTLQEFLLGTKGCLERQTDNGADSGIDPFISGRK